MKIEEVEYKPKGDCEGLEFYLALAFLPRGIIPVAGVGTTPELAVGDVYELAGDETVIARTIRVFRVDPR